MARKKSSRRARVAKVRVMLADSEALVVEAFRALLEREFDVLGTVTDWQSLVHECRSLKPDVVVLDVTVPSPSGQDPGRALLAACPSAKLVYLTNKKDRVAAEALRFGAAGHVPRSADAGKLKSAIRSAMSGSLRVGVLASLSDAEDDPGEHLTIRQKEVLQLIAEGRSMKEVAEILHVTARTVAFHKYNMMDRLQVKSTAELVQFAVKHGVVGLPLANSHSKPA